LSSLFSSAVEAANSEKGEKEEIVNEQKEPEHENAGREDVQEQAAVEIKEDEDEGEEKSSASILKHEDGTV